MTRIPTSYVVAVQRGGIFPGIVTVACGHSDKRGERRDGRCALGRLLCGVVEVCRGLNYAMGPGIAGQGGES